MSKEEDVERGGGTKGITGYKGNPPGYYSSSYYSENSEKQWRSWLIPLFVAANTVVFIVTMYVNNCPKNNSGFKGGCVAKFLGKLSFQPLKENPLFGPSVSALQKMGGLQWYSVVHGHEGWRLVTCIWLHSGVIHLLVNMLTLVIVGIRLEQQYGYVKIGVIYLLSGLGGTILSSLFLRNIVSVGASGALFGLLGAIQSEILTNWTLYTNKAVVLFTLIFMFAINLVVGILPLGGFLTGFLLGFVLLVRPQFGWLKREHQSVDSRVKSKYKAYQYILGLVALVLLIVGITIGLVMLFRDVNGNDHCGWCHYLQCVPTSKWDCNN